MLLREEWARSAQGKKVADGRCGRTIEAKPVSDQTCLIEPAEDVAYDSGGRNLDMAALVSALPCRNIAAAIPLLCLGVTALTLDATNSAGRAVASCH